MAESIEIVNIANNSSKQNSYSFNGGQVLPKGNEEDPQNKHADSSKKDWTDTYKEIFESKPLFTIKGRMRVRMLTKENKEEEDHEPSGSEEETVDDLKSQNESQVYDFWENEEETSEKEESTKEVESDQQEEAEDLPEERCEVEENGGLPETEKKNKIDDNLDNRFEI